MSNATKRSALRRALRATPWMLAACTFLDGTAHAAPPDTMRIWRAQVRFITADVGDAGTDDSVQIELKGGNRTWLDSGRDDRERGTDETFDLRLEGVETLSDIDYLRIEKNGSDGWAIRKMYLIINEKVIYEEEFPSTLWLDNEDGHSRVYVMDDSFMRPLTQWASYTVPPRPNVVPLDDMRLRIEGLAGDFATTDYMANHGYGYKGLLMAKFGAHSVEPYTLTTDTWRVDLDMEADGTFFDLDIDADFDLKVSCSSGRPAFIVNNVNVSADLYWDEMDRARDFVSGDFRFRLDQMMKNFHYTPFCPSIVLASNGDLHFNPKVPPIGDLPVQVFDDTLSPVGVHVALDEIKSFAETKFVATVKSRLEKDAELEISFALPAQVEPWDTFVEVNEGKERRNIEANLIKNDDGTLSMAFRDVVPAKQDTQYALRLMFQPKTDGVEELVTLIQPADRELQASITPLKAVTYFVFKSDSVFSEGTAILNSTYVAAEKEETKTGSR